MEYIEFILLGILQGITEFLPISSSGHLLIGRKIFGINEYGLLIEIVLHLGTLLSIILFWHKDIKEEFKLFINGDKQFTYAIIIATIPASIVGVLFQEYIKEFFFNIESMKYLSFNYLLLSIIIFSSKFINEKNKSTVIYKYALLIGIAQSIAILPGFSRSGLTIVMAMYLGLSFKSATKFSFLLAIPILIFASFDSIYEYFLIINSFDNFNIPLLLGFITSFITGYFILGILKGIIENRKFWYFSIYCFLISLSLFYGI
mgnify:CR=1 FL=1|tara:strand:+ start:330 stop:1109 length:780 start_codon:yes stop_codon:yes gene_type:complete